MSIDTAKAMRLSAWTCAECKWPNTLMYLPDVKLFRNPQLLQGGEHSTVPVVLF